MANFLKIKKNKKSFTKYIRNLSNERINLLVNEGDLKIHIRENHKISHEELVYKSCNILFRTSLSKNNDKKVDDDFEMFEKIHPKNNNAKYTRPYNNKVL